MLAAIEAVAQVVKNREMRGKRSWDAPTAGSS